MHLLRNYLHVKSRLRYFINLLTSTRKHFLLNQFSNHAVSITKRELISYLNKIRIKKNCNTINYIGSGESALKTCDPKLSKGLFIGGNLTCLLPVFQQIYFTEWNGNNHSLLISYLRYIYQVRAKYIGLLVNKSLSQDHNYIPYNKKNSLSKYYLKEASFPILSEHDISFFIAESLNHKKEIFTQSLSSTFTAIALAYLSGFKEINLYGVDFGGQYFWDTEEFKCLKEKMSLPYNFPRGYKYGSEILYPIRAHNQIHETQSAKFPTSKIIDIFSKELEKNNFKINNLGYLK